METHVKIWRAGATLAVLALCALQAAAQPVASQAPLTKSDVESWLDGLIPYSIDRGDIAGGVVVVVKDGQILAEKGYGYADVAKKTPVDPEQTLFRPGSISKLFTATAVMQLVEQGKLNLDSDVNQYLDFKIPARDGQPITLRNIMTHTSGFEETLKGLMGSATPLPLGDYLKAWIPERVFPPGKIPAYSNYASALAGYIVQRVSGEPFADYAQNHILTPLGMAHSSFQQPLPQALQPQMSQGYVTGSGQPHYYEMVGVAPAGALAATGADMGKFMIAHLQNGSYNGAQILKPETAIAMHAVQPKIYPALNGMALNFYEHSRNGHRVIAHNGGTQYFHSDLHLFIDDGVGIFISLNSPGSEGAAGAVHDALFHGFADRYFPAAAPLAAEAVDVATATEHARLMAGNWESSRRSYSNFMAFLSLLSPLQITAKGDGTINLRLGSGKLKNWREIAPFVWRETDGQNKIQAVLAGGQPVMIGLDAAAPAALLRIPAYRSPTWLVPAFAAALAALLLTGISWPVAAIARKTYGVPFALSGRPAIAYRLVRALSLVLCIVFIAFPLTLLSMSGDLSNFSSSTDGVMLFFQAAITLSVIAATLAAGWNAILIWTAHRRGFAKFWSVLVLASCLVVLWVSILTHLIGFTAHY
jgi:CubicO group peptidase (beta-lactamase class C family)